MKYKLSQRDIEAIEKSINQKGQKKAEVGIENGKVIVLEVEKRKVITA